MSAERAAPPPGVVGASPCCARAGTASEHCPCARARVNLRVFVSIKRVCLIKVQLLLPQPAYLDLGPRKGSAGSCSWPRPLRHPRPISASGVRSTVQVSPDFQKCGSADPDRCILMNVGVLTRPEIQSGDPVTEPGWRCCLVPRVRQLQVCGDSAALKR